MASLHTRLLDQLTGKPSRAQNSPRARIAHELVQRLAPAPHAHALALGDGELVGLRALLARTGPGGSATGVTSSRQTLGEWARRFPRACVRGRLRLHIASGAELPLPHTQFDAALWLGPDQAFEEPLARLQELRRVLRPQGQLALGLTSPRARLAPGELADALRVAGWERVRVTALEHGFAVLARRPEEH